MANGNGAGLAGVARHLITALPPAMLVLCLILAAVLWFEDQRADDRLALLQKIVDRCLPSASGDQRP